MTQTMGFVLIFLCVICIALLIAVLIKLSGNKNCDMIHLKELQPLTGYIRGGCSPIGMKKHFPTYIHRTALDYPYIYVSAGVRGLQMKLAPADLIRAAQAEPCELF